MQKSNLEFLQTALKSVYADKAQFNITTATEAYRKALMPYAELCGLSNSVSAWNKSYEHMVDILNPIKVNSCVEDSVKLFSNIAFQTYVENYRSLTNAMESSMFALGKLLEPLQINMDASELFTSISENIIQRNYTENDESELNLFDMVNQTYKECYGQENGDSEEGFKSNEEIQEAFEQHCSNPVGFQERICNWTEKMIRQFFIAYCVLKILSDIFFVPYLQENVGMPVMAYAVAHVKEFPEKASDFIGDLKENVEAIIIDNVPYYYKVTFTDENGDVKEGYVSKRSVRLIEDSIETDEPKETEETELQTDLER